MTFSPKHDQKLLNFQQCAKRTKKSKFHVKMHCKMNWKGASLGVFSRGALFPKFHFLQSLFLLLPVFFNYLRCFFLAPISMLRFSAPFPTPLTPLDQFRFFYVFVNILAPFSYFCLLPLFPVSFIIFATPWFLSYS